MNKVERNAVLGIAIASALGLLLAWAGGDGGTQVGGWSVFAIATLAAFGINIVVFVPSYLTRTEHYYDLTGSLTYLSVTLLALLITDDLDTRSVIIAILVFVWAGRLGLFLFRRVRKDGRDARFDEIKQSWLRFLMAWVVQGLWVTLTAGTAIAAITSGTKADFGVIGVLGLVIWLIGFGIEATSDSQKTAFKNDPNNAGTFIAVGLWGWSRHPNYFGEITLWAGIALIAIPGFDGREFVALVSPLFVLLLLTKISGLPGAT